MQDKKVKGLSSDGYLAGFWRATVKVPLAAARHPMEPTKAAPFTPTQLSTHLACPHYTQLERKRRADRETALAREKFAHDTGLERSVSAAKAKHPPGADHEKLRAALAQAYRILPTRGMSGCYLWIEDPQTRDYANTWVRRC